MESKQLISQSDFQFSCWSWFPSFACFESKYFLIKSFTDLFIPSSLHSPLFNFIPHHFAAHSPLPLSAPCFTLEHGALFCTSLQSIIPPEIPITLQSNATPYTTASWAYWFISHLILTHHWLIWAKSLVRDIVLFLNLCENDSKKA